MNRQAYVRPTAVTIDEGAFRNNWARLRAAIPAETRILAIVKANAYGHGSVEITRLCERLGAAGVGVADVSEAIVLRDGGYPGEILCLGAIPETALPVAIEQNLTVALHDPGILPPFVSAAKKRGHPLRVHVKIETGMNRLGVERDRWEDTAAALLREGSLSVEGIFTHLAESDAPDPAFTDRQLGIFGEAVTIFEGTLRKRLLRHTSNSGGALLHPAGRLDWVRPGIALYGYPSGAAAHGFTPVLEWKAPILQTKRLSAGDTVGYNRTFRAGGPMTIATVAAGYGDGYRRGYAPVGVGFRGRRTRLVGTVCMDLLMIDVTEFPDVRPGEEVYLLGRKERGGPDAHELARAERTVAYEVLTGISARVSRRWTAEGPR